MAYVKGTTGVTRVTTDWQGESYYAEATSDDGLEASTGLYAYGSSYMSDGSTGYIPSVWAGKL